MKETTSVLIRFADQRSVDVQLTFNKDMAASRKDDLVGELRSLMEVMGYRMLDMTEEES